MRGGTIYKIDERTHTARYKKIKTIKHLKPLTMSAAFLYIAQLDVAICYITSSRNDLVKLGPRPNLIKVIAHHFCSLEDTL